MRARSGLVTGVLVAGLVAGAPVAAGAAVTNPPVGVGASGIGTATAVCPQGTLVYGTGGNSRRGVRAVVPDSQLRRVTVTAADPAAAVTAYALCGGPAAAPRLVAAGGQGSSATVACPDGTTLSGTGGAASGFLTGIAPNLDLGTVTVTGTGGSTRAYGICGDFPNLLLVKVSSPYDAESPKVATADCPIGMDLFNGSATVKDGGNIIALGAALNFAADSVTATGWDVSPGLARWSVTAFATCG
ncbi:MAG TPA: hypothetical protein VFV67_11875 [Actinophytocola sp.]|uniref:hypothetical protein n=1 Tax=Actinophytocola sp. TaxID=1872138 RepID=UPI002DB808EB|nr:hypothetical protein [Actinophytocola sp.]HEU5471344.1 hypothetical protein [Actinophytocola sp.]